MDANAEVSHVFTGLAVADLAAATEWYERLFGRPPDMLPNESEAVWRVAATSSVYVVADAARAGGGSMMVIVDDIDGQLAAIAGRGLEAGAVETLSNGVRKAVIADPDGNLIQLGQVGG